MPKTNLVVKSATWSTIATVIITLCQVTQLVVLGRLLTPEMFGVMAILIVIVSFCDYFSQMGIGEAVIQEKKIKPYELITLFWLNNFLGLVMFCLLIIFNNVADYYYDTAVYEFVPFIAVSLLITPLSTIYKALLQKELQIKNIAVAEIFGALVGTTGAILFAMKGYELWSLIWGYLLKIVVTNILVIISARNLLKLEFVFKFNRVKRYLSFGVHLLFSNLLNFINSRIDQVIIGAVLGTQALGYYSMAFNLVIQPISKINPIVTRIAFPLMAKVSNDTEKLKDTYFKVLNIVATINAPILIGFIAIAPILIPFALGDKWVPIIPIVQILSLYTLIRSIGNPGGSLVMAVGRSDILFYWNLLLSFLIPLVLYLTAIQYGLMGVAYGLFILQFILYFLWYFFVVVRVLNKAFKLYVFSIFTPLFISFSMFLVLYFMNEKLIMQGGAMNLFILCTAGGGVYIVLSLLLRKNEVEQVLKVLKRK